MTWELSLTGLLLGVGTDILHGAIFKTIGAWRHRMLGHVHARLTFWLALGSVPASLAGVYVIELLKDHFGEDINDVASRILGVALVLGGIGFLVRVFVHKGAPSNRPYLLTDRDRVHAVVIGLVGGFVLGLTSVGSGTFFGLMLLLLFPLTAPKVVGTDLFHAAVLLWAAGLAHLSANNVDLEATGWLALGSIPGILIGSQFTVRLPERTIRVVLATVLLLAGLRLALG